MPRRKYPRTKSTHPQYDHPHATVSVSPNEAQKQLTAFLAKTKKTPHLHPDSFLSRTGVTFSIDSGPEGGIALHHIDRINRALKGESLELETWSELAAQFGDEAVRSFAGDIVRKSDDSRLDALIEGRETKRSRTAAWAEDVSSVAEYATPREIESFANTPLHVPNYFEEEQNGLGALLDDDDPALQDKEDFDRQQEVLTGEVDSDRQGARVVQQGGIVPPIVEHDRDGNVIIPPKGKTKEEKEARKAAKRLRKQEEKNRHDEQKQSEWHPKPATHLDPPNHTGEAQEGPEVAVVAKIEEDKRARKEAKRQRKEEARRVKAQEAQKGQG